VRAVVYSETGGPDVLRLVERPAREPGPDEVRVKVRVSGVNPTDCKARSGGWGTELPFSEVVPNQDGAGTIDAVGDGVDGSRVGERVWLWEAAWQRAHGTAQEAVVLPSRQAVLLPDDVSFDAWREPRHPGPDGAPVPHPLGGRTAGTLTRSSWRCDCAGGGRRWGGRPRRNPARAVGGGTCDQHCER
jgi:NADPH2:quinone reductase